MGIRVKRVYDPPDPEDGQRVLVDRVWPRGLKKEALHADLWLPEIAPSEPLRKWFGHDSAKWREFKARYFEELDAKPDVVEKVLRMAASGPLTLLFSARDRQHNQAVALREYLILCSKEADDATNRNPDA